MSLTLRITSLHKLTPDIEPVRTIEAGSSLTIGRAPGNDWVLPDPELVISGRHCTVHEEHGRYLLTDTSTNGVYLGGQRVGRGNSQPLQAGDVIGIGDYEISVEAGVADAPAAGAFDVGPGLVSPAPDPFGLGRPASPPADDPFGLDPGVPDPFGLGSRPLAEPYGPGRGGDVFPATAGPDPFGLTPGAGTAEAGGDPYGLLAPTPVSSAPVHDHVPSEQQAFVPPAPVSDDDWDALFAAAAPKAASPSPLPEHPGPAAVVPEPPPVPPLPEPFPGPLAAVPDLAIPSSPEPRLPPIAAERTPIPSAPPAPPPVPAVAAGAAPIEAFLAGSGLANLQVPAARQAELMHALGKSYRLMVQGLMAVLRARTNLKGEFRMNQTSIRPIENNPLKFAPSVEEAMALLLTTRSNSYLPPERAIGESFEDLQAHQLAMMAGMQAALGHLFRRFDPATLEARFGNGGGLLPGSRKARCWEQFSALYQEIAREAEDDFQELFGREFVRAYEEQIARLRSR